MTGKRAFSCLCNYTDFRVMPNKHDKPGNLPDPDIFTFDTGGAAAAEKNKHETTGAWYSGVFAQEPENKAANPTANKPKLVKTKTEEKKAASTKKKDDKVEEVSEKKDVSSPWSWSGIFAAADQAGAGAAPTSKTKHVKPVTAWWWPGFLS